MEKTLSDKNEPYTRNVRTNVLLQLLLMACRIDIMRLRRVKQLFCCMDGNCTNYHPYCNNNSK